MTSSTPFLFEKDYSRKLGRGHAGAAVSAQLARQRAIDRYYAKPNKCGHCGEVIPVPDGIKVSQIRVKRYCNSSCSAKDSNGKRRTGRSASSKRKNRLSRLAICNGCGDEFHPWSADSKFCSQSCASKATPREERVRRGRINSESARANRYKQLAWEEAIAAEMRVDGWEIFSPTVVCDRVGVKDGKVFFLEFKPVNNQTLRPGQQRIADLVPEMYKIVAR